VIRSEQARSASRRRVRVDFGRASQGAKRPLLRYSALRLQRARAKQGGLAAIVLLVALVMGSLYALVNSMSTATAQIAAQRDEVTQAALKEAKQALIAWAALRASQGPGHLPCPDRDNDGDSEGAACGNADTRIGRLPWKTLGLPDLRDSSGERLWYVISSDFLNQTGNPVNSNTQGQLTVTGASAATGIVAIIFAPGPALAGQDRSGPQWPAKCNVATDNNCRVQNYLEGENANAPDKPFENMASSTDLFEVRTRCEQANCQGGQFNDQLIVITHADLFDVVENVVAKRVQDQIAPKIQDYVSAWGIYPFAAPFDDQTLIDPPTTPQRAQNKYYGRNTTNGLLPVAYDESWTGVETDWVGWDKTSFSVTKSGSGDDVPVSCAWQFSVEVNDSRYVCTFNYSPPLTVHVRGTMKNVARSFALPVCLGGCTDPSQNLRVNVSGIPISPKTPTQSIQSTGDAQVEFDLALLPIPAVVSITFPPPQFSPLVKPKDDALGWFVKNNWHQQTYYAVADGCRLGGGSCVAGVTVQDSEGASVAKAVLVLAGRHLLGGTRGWTIANYFESNNASSPSFNETTNNVFRRGFRSQTFNDKLVVVAP